MYSNRERIAEGSLCSPSTYAYNVERLGLLAFIVLSVTIHSHPLAVYEVVRSIVATRAGSTIGHQDSPPD